MVHFSSVDNRLYSRRTIKAVLLLLGVLFLTGCIGSQARVELETSFNALGWGRHEMVLAVPGQFYDGALFDRLPDFSLITGVKLQDYKTADWQGIQATQSFYRLGSLTGDPGRAHFLNKAYPGDPITFRADWKQGFFTRDLDVQVFINTGRSNALAEALSLSAKAALDATFILEMPGQVLQHNGSAIDERTIIWTLDPGMPQTLTVSARVIDIPLILATVFLLGSSGLALYTWATHSGSSNGPKSKRPRLQPPRSHSRRSLPPPARPPRRPAPRR